jgi:phosphoglycerate dehydrogenase-like enzyme
MRRVVVSVNGLGAENHARIVAAAVAAGVSVAFLPEDSPEVGPSLTEAEVFFGIAPAHQLVASPVSFVQLHSSGFEPYRTSALIGRPNFALANARGVTAQAVAEHAIAMIFAFARRLPLHIRNQPARVWQRAPGYQLVQGSTVTILGLGAIGSALGRMLNSLGATVLVVQRNPVAPEFATAAFPLERLRDALARSQHAVICLPSIERDRPLVGAAELAALPPGGFLYNVSRAALLDYSALEAALTSGHLGGAGLDVFPEEPLPPACTLWQMSNVIISPHAGGRFAGEMNALTSLFVDNLTRYLSGQPLRNVVIGGADRGN